MTPDFASATEPELRTWLAELPCPWFVDGDQTCEECDNTGLALPWASVPCPCLAIQNSPCGGCFRVEAGRTHSPDCRLCNGSGRVPKALGLDLEDLPKIGITHISFREGGGKEWWEAWAGKGTGKGGTPTLAALRAVAAQAQAGMR